MNPPERPSGEAQPAARTGERVRVNAVRTGQGGQASASAEEQDRPARELGHPESGRSDGAAGHPQAGDAEPGKDPERPPGCLVVGLGASAGGLEAFQEFFERMPPDSGMSFVLIQHLDPDHASLMPQLLARYTAMPVIHAEDGMTVVPDTVYVIPPNTVLTLQNGRIRLAPPRMPRGRRTPIDCFFESLAVDQGERAVCIILSGTGSDGVAGVRAVRERGGLVLAQAPESARYDGMPQSAISTGLVDSILPVGDMPAQLLAHRDHPAASAKPPGLESALVEPPVDLDLICDLLRQRTGHDFTFYKKGTLLRRIQRRVEARGLANAEAYVQLLSRDPAEADALFQDFLIGVTRFFRDAEEFRFLETEVIARLLERADPETDLRIWSIGCASGEEAYSLAIAARERADRMTRPPRIQIFATDIDEEALETARAGRYPDTALEHVSGERVSQYFTRLRGYYQVSKRIREMCLFSKHDLLRDPPFSRLDVIVCRNLLIYLEGEIQKRIVPLFHYSLNPGGYLFLGPTESLAAHAELFQPLDGKRRIFQRVETPSRPGFPFPLVGPAPAAPQAPGRLSPSAPGIGRILERVLLEDYCPTAVVVNAQQDIVYYTGRTGPYLEPAPGVARHGLLEMARQGLRMDLRAAIQEVTKTQRPAIRENAVIQVEGVLRRVEIAVRPMPEMGQETGMYLVVFRDMGRADVGPTAEEAVPTPAGAEMRLRHLEGELRATKAHLQTAVEELETSNEELKSSNEELLSMNEELQASNEELQTSREELQSVNEELHTVNTELSKKVEELDRANSDLQNHMESTQIATLFLGEDLRIKGFTPAATAAFKVIERDIGRLISDIAPRFAAPDLEHEIGEVLRSRVVTEREVSRADGKTWYRMRILPYRTVANVYDGVVITFEDISALKQGQAEISEAREAAEHRAHQQAAVAKLGTTALQEPSLQRVFDVAAHLVTDTLGTEYCELLELTQDGGTLVYRGGHGWRGDPDERVVEVVEPDTLSGQALQSGGHAAVADLSKTGDLRPSRRLLEHRVVSGLSAAIPGRAGRWGVISAYSSRARRFSQDDVHFVTAVANTLASAIRGQAARQALAESGDRLRAALSAAEVGTWRWEIGAEVVTRDASLNRILGLEPEDTAVPVTDFLARIHPEDRAQVESRLERSARTRAPYDAEFRVLRADGGVAWIRDRGRVFARTDLRPDYMTGAAADITEIRHAEDELRKTNQRVRDILESIRDAFIALDRNWRFTYVNHSAAEQFGRATEELVGSSAWGVFPAAVRPTFEAGFRKAMEDQAPVHFEEFYAPRDCWYEFHCYPSMDGLSVFFHEITARKRAEMALRESERRLELAVGAGDGFWDVRFDPENPHVVPDEIYLSPGQKQMIGFEEHEFPNSLSAWQSRIVPEDLEELRERMQAHIDGGSERLDAEYRIRHRNGSLRWIQTRGTISRDAQGNPARWTGIDWDVSARKQSEEVRARLATIVETSQDAILGKTLDGIITSWNRGAEVMYGYTAAEMVGRSISTIMPPDGAYQEELAVIYRKLRRGERMDTFETVRVRKDGRHIHVALTISPILDARGNPVAASAIARDITRRKEAEQALVESEERYRVLVQTTASVVWTTDARGEFIVPQPSWEAYTGQPWEEQRGLGWLEKIHPDDRAAVQRQWEGALKSRARYEAEGRLWHAESRAYRYFTVRGAPLLDTVGKVRGWVGMIRDVDARRRAEQKARESEQRFQLLADAAPVMIWMSGPDRGCTYFNRGWLEFRGRTMEEELGSGWVEGVHAEDREDCLRAYAAAFERRQPFQLEYRLRRADGEYRWILDHGEPRFAQDRFAGYIGSAVDITELKEAEVALRHEEALRASEARLREMADALPQIVWTAGATGEVEYLNRRWFQYSGQKPTPAAASGWLEHMHSEDREAFAETWEAAARAGEVLEAECRLRQSDGEWRWHLMRAVPLKDERDRVRRWLGTATDVHDQKLTAEALRQADRRKDEFLAMLAHELRNPLAPILNAVQVLRAREGGDEKVDRSRAVIERQGLHMARLVDDLLEVSRITHGRIELRKTRVTLGPIVDAAVESCRPLVEEAGHTLRVSLPEDPVPLLADAARLHQVLGNLLTNAVKYTDPGGTIWLSAKREGDQVLLSVRDTGIGIPVEMLPRIWEMFTRAKTGSRGGTGGLGLGLCLVKNLVELHDGSVEARSEGIGKGSELLIRLPIASPEASPSPEPSPRARQPGQAAVRRVLVVDDNRDVADTLAELVALWEHHVLTAYDGPSALALAREFRPDVILLDIGLPGMDGYEVARRIRGDAESRHALLVAVTGYGQSADRPAPAKPASITT